ncbi:hypothetical protein C8F01DRAFT_381370 [Mycena amicta]|nr:hypothetical protein C8F01DRAFT_381370 [Mycena amicta]
MLKHLVSQMQPFACVGALFRFFVQPSLVFLFPAASLNDVPSPCNGPPSPTVDFVPQANSAIYFWFVVLIVLATGGTGSCFVVVSSNPFLTICACSCL